MRARSGQLRASAGRNHGIKLALVNCSGFVVEQARNVAGAMDEAHDLDALWQWSVEDEVVLEAAHDPRTHPMGPRRAKLARTACPWPRQEHSDCVFDGVEKALSGRW